MKTWLCRKLWEGGIGFCYWFCPFLGGLLDYLPLTPWKLKSQFSVLYICKTMSSWFLQRKAVIMGLVFFFYYDISLLGVAARQVSVCQLECSVFQFLAVASILSWTTVLLSFLASPLSIIRLHRSPVWCIMSVKPFLSSPLHNMSFQCFVQCRRQCLTEGKY